jgi:plasmid replication initiation protein
MPVQKNINLETEPLYTEWRRFINIPLIKDYKTKRAVDWITINKFSLWSPGKFEAKTVLPTVNVR